MEPESWKNLVDLGCSEDCIKKYKRLTDDNQRFLYCVSTDGACWIRSTTSNNSWTASGLLTASVKKEADYENISCLLFLVEWQYAKDCRTTSTGDAADIARIETVKPYEGDYMDVFNQGQREVNQGYKLTSRSFLTT